MTACSPKAANKAAFILAIMAAAVLGFAALSPALAESRTAGSIPVSEKKTEPKEADAETGVKEPAKEKAKAPKPEKAAKKPAEEAEKEKEEEEKKVLAAKISFDDFESAGLLHAERDGGLGSDLWRGARRSELVELLQTVQGAEESSTLTELKRRLLLTAASTRGVSDDVPIAAGEDLLSLRLNKLTDIGFYREAFELYAQLNTTPHDNKLAAAGVKAMLYAGQKSLACLEAKTVEQYFGNEPFWKEMLAYCDLTILKNPDPQSAVTLRASDKKIFREIADNNGFRFMYHPRRFEELSPIEQAVLVADKRLDTGTVSGLNFSAVPARHIQLLLGNDKIDDRSRMMLTIQAVRHGIMPPAKLAELYVAQANPAAGEEDAPAEEAVAGWQRLAQLYNQADSAENRAALWPILQQVFGLKGQYGVAALTPFASFIERAQPEKPGFAKIRTAFEVMQAAGRELPPAWMDELEALAPQGENASKAKTYNRFYIVVFASRPDYRRTEEQRTRIIEYLKSEKPAYSALVNIIIENLDNPAQDNDNAAAIYEKDFGLTSKDDYVMPSGTVWDRLKEASRKKSLSETILLSALALRGSHPGKAYPGLLRDVLDGFEAVGLSEFSRNLAVEALLENS